jgi:hypothetical protein
MRMQAARCSICIQMSELSWVTRHYAIALQLLLPVADRCEGVFLLQAGGLAMTPSFAVQCFPLHIGLVRLQLLLYSTAPHRAAGLESKRAHVGWTRQRFGTSDLQPVLAACRRQGDASEW